VATIEEHKSKSMVQEKEQITFKIRMPNDEWQDLCHENYPASSIES